MEGNGSGGEGGGRTRERMPPYVWRTAHAPGCGNPAHRATTTRVECPTGVDQMLEVFTTVEFVRLRIDVYYHSEQIRNTSPPRDRWANTDQTAFSPRKYSKVQPTVA